MNTFGKRIGISLCAAAVLGLAACASPDDPNRTTKTGAAAGAVLGAAIGGAAGGHLRGAAIGAAAGALTGAAVGHYMDNQRHEMERQLAAEAARNELRITEMPGGFLRVGVAADASFDFNSAQIRPQAEATYSKIASVVKTYDKTVIHVVGNTDSVGSDSYNQQLSQRRASAVANLLMAQGVPSDRLREEGRGKREPIASNDTDEGRSRNRRVDIVIKPVVEGHEADAYTPPPYLGS